MTNLYKNLSKLPDTEKEIVSFKANGKKVIKKIKITDRYLLTLNSGDSVAIREKDFGLYGISKAPVVIPVEEDEDENDADFNATPDGLNEKVKESVNKLESNNSPLILEKENVKN